MNKRQKMIQTSHEIAVYIDLKYSDLYGKKLNEHVNSDPFVIAKRKELREDHFYDGIQTDDDVGVIIIGTTKADIADLIRSNLTLRQLASVLGVSSAKAASMIREDQDLIALWETRVAVRKEVVVQFADGRVQRYLSVGDCSRDLGISIVTVNYYVNQRRHTPKYKICRMADYLQSLEDRFQSVGGAAYV